MVFTGLIERPANSDNKMVLTGRSSATRTLGKLVTYSATAKARSEIVTDLISKYFDGIITTTNVQLDSGIATVNYSDKPFWEVIQELCSAGNYDAYVDATFDLHYFPSGTITNQTEAVVDGYNLISTGDFSPDMQSIINRVKVHGQEVNRIQILATAEDTLSQSLYDVKESKIDDTSIDSETEAQARADYELSKNLTPPTVGSVTSLLLPTLVPGERVRISDPLNGLAPSDEGYTIQKFTHKFSNDDPPQTELTVQKERSSIPQILKKRIKFEYTSTSSLNPNEMDYSKVFTFDTDSGTHSTTQIVSGVLKPTSTSGNWISEDITLSISATHFEARLDATGVTNISVFVSTNGGATYSYLAPNVQTTLTAGSVIRVKVAFDASTPEINTLGIYYKT